MKITAQQVQNLNVSSSKDGNIWKPCRSLNYQFESFISRIENAWGVLIGKYDALDWEGH